MVSFRLIFHLILSSCLTFTAVRAQTQVQEAKGLSFNLNLFRPLQNKFKETLSELNATITKVENYARYLKRVRKEVTQAMTHMNSQNLSFGGFKTMKGLINCLIDNIHFH